jgi:transcriptional regulator with XRE-family HTH domain
VDPAKKSLRKLGNRIRTLRKARGWSQEEFAFQANIARSYIGGVERGERNLSFINIARIAGALDISIAVLCQSVPSIPPDR